MSNIPHTLAQHITPSSLYALEQAVLGWAHERNLIEGSTCRKQLAKTCEEFGELAAGLNKGKRELIKDGVGDVLVTLIIANGCAGSTGIFRSEPQENYWLEFSVCDPSKLDYSEVVLRLLYELDYITERSNTVLYTWRTERMRYMIRWLKVAAQWAECSMAECLQVAWLEIKDRKGRMIDGVFVKEADLPPEQHQVVQAQPTLGERFDNLSIDEQVQVTCGSGTVRSPQQEAPVPPDHNC